MQEASNEELLNNENSENSEQAQPEVIREDDYKNLQSSYTKANQERIELATRLAEKDKSYILDIKDRKLQDKVIKEIYWLNNLEEVKVIHWDKFYETRDDYNDDDEDRTAKLEKELKILKYTQTKWEIESAILEYKKENKILFEDSEVEDKLREELTYISDKLPHKERVKRAASIIFWFKNNPVDNAYAELKEKWAYIKWDDKSSNNKTKTKLEETVDNAFWNILTSSKSKEAYKAKFL